MSPGRLALQKLTYKLLCAGKVEEFDEAKVISTDEVEASV